MTEKTPREQSITIQVMRLAKPIPNQPISSFCGPSDTILYNFSDVFLGECFTFYVAIINTTLFKCEQINMKVDIQTQLQRISIAETSFSNVSLVHKQQVGQIFSHEINELGQHILVCSVSYIGGNEEKLNLRKFFKFSVNKPVDLLNQTFYELNDKTTFYEFQIKNLTPNPIFIEFLTFEECGNNLPYNCELTGSPTLNIDSEPLGLQNIHQYIFRLIPNEQCDAENWRKILNFGRLKIVWRSTTGDNGRTFFNTIERSQFICRDLRLLLTGHRKKQK
uniref:Uncharacterized protein n=1 Tax=Meloidogyne incognita TaxID=6306 RepID=A0A914KTH1_MELIC